MTSCRCCFAGGLSNKVIWFLFIRSSGFGQAEVQQQQKIKYNNDLNKLMRARGIKIFAIFVRENSTG